MAAASRPGHSWTSRSYQSLPQLLLTLFLIPSCVVVHSILLISCLLIAAVLLSAGCSHRKPSITRALLVQQGQAHACSDETACRV